jgi:hypothetical protein
MGRIVGIRTAINGRIVNSGTTVDGRIVVEQSRL